ncbi:unnamed protein product [Ceutorhynchus assimilis]|uniref:Arrestin C-terminal-like domain-containing protein n=1 Tax=Ceutorhynchus assimilis TaxID=467358 RepID=A0A9N9MFD9_9CUCU|nr:unnamed protein product [Ceutorhynchus assimilis]
MPQQCKLLLDNYAGYYLAGSVIHGRVLFDTDSEIAMRGIRITLSCNEHTEWIGTESYYDTTTNEQKSRDTLFTGDKEVTSINQWVYGDQHASTSLPPGQHMYQFAFTLPQNIPGTYRCEKGSIIWKLVATVDRQMAFDNQDQMIIVVQSPVDLNFIARPDDLEPSMYSDEKTVCCWCCAQGPISMDVELTKRVLVPTEPVQIKMTLSNMSNTNVEGVSVELKQIFSYKVDTPNRDDRQDTHILIDLKDVGLGAHGEHTFLFNVNLPPNVNLPNFAQCGLFSVEYVYKAIAQLPSMHNNLEVTMHPKVGNIPLGASAIGQSHSQGRLYHPFGEPNPSAPSMDSKEQQGFQGVPGHFEQPPPTYDSLNTPKRY